jgi:hypothetical protein
MYYQLNNFTGRLIGSSHIQPYFPIVSTKFLSAVYPQEYSRLWAAVVKEREYVIV